MPISKITLKILAMPDTMTNRQVADALGLEIDTVKDARRYNGSKHIPEHRDKGYKAKILNLGRLHSAEKTAAMVGCTARYVRSVWDSIKSKNN